MQDGTKKNSAPGGRLIAKDILVLWKPNMGQYCNFLTRYMIISMLKLPQKHRKWPILWVLGCIAGWVGSGAKFDFAQ